MIEGTTQESFIVTESGKLSEKPSGVPVAFFIASGLLLLGFSKVLFDLVQYSLKVDLHSHALLVPFISLYLIRQDRAKLPPKTREFSLAAVVLLLTGVFSLTAFFIVKGQGIKLETSDYLAFTSFSFVALFTGTAVYFLGKSFAKAIAFPLAFLIFLVPFPRAVQDTIEIWAQYASADMYAWMLDATFVSYLRDGQTFHMPGLSLVVAQECSGVRSSFVLFITSLLAGYMFLKSPWRRAALSLCVFPLAIVRNGFRIWTLSILSMHWDPGVIHSPLHHRGGPIFFALSLIPFFGILYWLRRRETKAIRQAATPVAQNSTN